MLTYILIHFVAWIWGLLPISQAWTPFFAMLSFAEIVLFICWIFFEVGAYLTRRVNNE